MDFYHILNRGVEKRDIVLDDGDRIRFVSDLYELNNKNIAANPLTKSRRGAHRSLLVRIHAWCLMSNHYHLLVSPVDDDIANISRFAQKIGMGYAKYFNEKYSRNGVLWQGIYKRIRIERDAHFNYIPYYIHLNPLDFSMPEWREGNVKRISQALKKLQEYRWSSYLDYVGTKNFPSILDTDTLVDVLGSPKRQHNVIAEVIQDRILANKSDVIEII
ncbi:MAG: transposase [Patescibacteria group bacterium]